jgi:hypothetical protein
MSIFGRLPGLPAIMPRNPDREPGDRVRPGIRRPPVDAKKRPPDPKARGALSCSEQGGRVQLLIGLDQGARSLA